jgi:hypothetical protein
MSDDPDIKWPQAVAWLHTMHRTEDGSREVEVTLSPQHPWGIAGRDYDNTVTSEPLFKVHEFALLLENLQARVAGTRHGATH